MEIVGGVIVGFWILLILAVVGLITIVLFKFWKEILSIILVGAAVIGIFVLLLANLS